MSPAGTDLLAAMSPAERRAHKALAAEMSVSDEALVRATARAMAAAAFGNGCPNSKPPTPPTKTTHLPLGSGQR